MSSVQLQIPLSQDARWQSLPSPKIRNREKFGVHSWTHAYAGFSFDFALEALRRLRVTESHTLLDPFVGSGTSAVAGATIGAHVIGIDVDPFSALITRAKAAVRADRRSVLSFLRRSPRSSRRTFVPAADELFTAEDLSYAAGVFDRVCSDKHQSPTAWTHMLKSGGKTLDSQVVAVAAITLAGRALAKVARGSNPVWFRAIRKAKTQRDELSDLAPKVAETLLNDLQTMYPSVPRVSVINASFLQANLPSRSVDRVLTSPPYLNRLDYVVSHFSEISILSGLFPLDTEALRRQMLGTTKMIGSPPADEAWGPACVSLLDRVRTHRSWASGTYYLKFYRQYFADLFHSMQEMRRVCRNGAEGILVVQDSFYKEIKIPLTTILMEMGQAVGIDVSELRTERTTGHIGSMSPRQRAYVPRKTLTESVMLLGF